MHYLHTIRLSLIIFWLLFSCALFAQSLQWTQDGNAYWLADKDGIAQMDFAGKQKTMIASAAQLTPAGGGKTVVHQIVQTFKRRQKNIDLHQ